MAYGVLFLLISPATTPKVAAHLGLLFGLGLHLTGHGWIYTTMAGPAGMDSASAALASAVVLLGLALFTALPCALHAKLVSGPSGQAIAPWLQAVVFASLVTLGEIARAMVWDRFSSLSMGYALIDTWLAGWAPVLGVYGLSWIGYWLAASLALTLAAPSPATKRRLLVLLSAACCLLAGLLLQQVQWTKPQSKPVHFRLVQPNTKQGDKFDPAHRARITEQMVAMLTAEPTDLVLAPETAFPQYWSALPAGTITALQDFATQSGTHLMFGIATVGSQSEGHNSMVHVQPKQSTFNRYDKKHLFPFGEYSPPGLNWITRKLAIPMQDLNAGANVQPPFTLAKGLLTVHIGSMICNEIMLSDEARRWAPLTTLLINPGNMAWFDGTLAIDQGQQIARMRALEVNRPILRVSNTGDTALISASGELQQMLALSVSASMTGSVFGQSGLTPYARWGDRPVWVLCLVCIGVALRFRLKPEA